MSNSPALPPGADPTDRVQRYGKYFLVRKLAEGGMAEIFLAKQRGAEGFERNVVIKRMLKHLTEVSDFVKMFLDEARLAARLAHQNVIQIYDLGLTDGCYYICMEYLAGEDFSTILRTAGRRREYVPIHIVLRVIADAAHGLHFAHESTDEEGNPLNIVHRDISPSNVYVTFQGQVKVLDFGIARAESRLAQTTAGVVKGKYMYMAPEQARGHVVDRRADVFSLGVSMYEALTNVRPFSRDNDLAILNAVLTGDFPPPRKLRPDLPAEVEQIVLKAMALKPEQRYASTAEMAADIERYLTSITSGMGGAQLSHYLRSLFGEERVSKKTRIPTLQNLIDSGQTVSGFTDPEMPSVTSPSAATAPGTRVVGPPSSVTQAANPRRPIFPWVLLLVAIAAAAGGGAFAWMQRSASSEPVTPAIAEVPQGLPVPAPAAAVDAGAPEALPAVAEAVEPAVAKPEPKRKPAARKRTTLEAADIQRVVNRGAPIAERCFKANIDELPTQKGQVIVQFTILASGKVTGVEVGAPLTGTKVARCLAEHVRRLRFPPHVDEGISLSLPFGWQ